jgi:hypothetical protein
MFFSEFVPNSRSQCDLWNGFQDSALTNVPLTLSSPKYLEWLHQVLEVLLLSSCHSVYPVVRVNALDSPDMTTVAVELIRS